MLALPGSELRNLQATPLLPPVMSMIQKNRVRVIFPRIFTKKSCAPPELAFMPGLDPETTQSQTGHGPCGTPRWKARLLLDLGLEA